MEAEDVPGKVAELQTALIEDDRETGMKVGLELFATLLSCGLRIAAAQERIADALEK